MGSMQDEPLEDEGVELGSSVVFVALSCGFDVVVVVSSLSSPSSGSSGLSESSGLSGSSGSLGELPPTPPPQSKPKHGGMTPPPLPPGQGILLHKGVQWRPPGPMMIGMIVSDMLPSVCVMG